MKALLINKSPFLLFVILLGLLFSVLVVFDPLLANIISKQLDLRVLNINLLKLYPYEISSIFLLMIIGIFFMKKFVDWLLIDTDKSFIILFIIGMHTIALTSMGKFDFSEIVLISFFIVLLNRAMLKHETTIKLTLFDFFNIFLFMILIVSTVNSNIISTVNSITVAIKLLLIGFLLVNAVRDYADFITLLKAVVIMTTISAIIGIIQEAIYLSTGILLVGITSKDAKALMFEPTSFGNILRIPAFFGTYKPLVFFLETAMLILFNYYLYKRPLPNKRMYILLLSFLLMFFALILTFSKDALLALFITFILSLLLWRPYLIFHFALCAVALIILITVLGGWSDISKLLSTELTWGEQRIRLQLAREGILGFIHKHPWIGNGIKLTKRYTGHYLGWPAHNAFIEAADATGIIGLTVFLTMIFYSMANIIKCNFVVHDVANKWIARSLLASFIAFLITIQFHPFFVEKFNWLLMGMIQIFTLIVFKKKQTVLTKC